MIKCSRCKQAGQFGPDKRRPSGLQSQCRECMRKGRNASNKKYRLKVNSNASIYRNKNRETIKHYFKKLNQTPKRKRYISQWYRTNANKISKMHKIWRLANLGIRAKDAANYRAKQRECTPKWLTETHLGLIEMEYKKARYLTEVTGIDWHVDHIIPIQGKNVSGLHVPWNLRVVVHSENESKSNKFNFY